MEKLTKKQQNYIEYSTANPLLTDAEISRDLNISTKQIWKWKKDPEFQAEITKQLDEQWRAYRKVAAQTMYNLCVNGDREASKFILQTTGVNPTQQVELNADASIELKVDYGQE